MTKGVAIFAVALVTLVVGGHVAFASDSSDIEICLPFLGCIGLGGSGGGHPAPAPLLAAGIPAFTALGGGVLASRLFRRGKPAA
jgi:hypothetical protein